MLPPSNRTPCNFLLGCASLCFIKRRCLQSCSSYSLFQVCGVVTVAVFAARRRRRPDEAKSLQRAVLSAMVIQVEADEDHSGKQNTPG